MAMNGKMRSEDGSRRRIRSKDEGSDASDDDYKIEDDQDSDEYCSSLAGEELEDELAEDVKGDKVRVAGRLNMRNATSKNRGRGGKASKKRKVSHEEGSDEEGSDEDFVIEDEDDFSEEEDSKGWMNFPKRKRNGVSKAVIEKKASNMEEKDDNFKAEEDVDDDDDDDDDEQEEEDYSDNEGETDLLRGCRGRKQIGIQKANKRKKVPYRKENDDCYKAEDDECEDDEDDNYNEDEDDLVNGRPRRKRNGVRKALKKKNSSDTEECDDDYEAKDDESDEDDYNEKDLRPSRKQCRVKKTVKRKRGPHTEESDDDYEAEIDESNDDDDYGSEEEVDEEEEEEEKEKEVEEDEDEDDEDFTPNEIEFEDENEFVVEKSKKVGRTPSQGRHLSRGKKRRNSRVTNNMSTRKEPAKRRGFQRKSSSNRRKQSTKGKSTVKQTSERRHGRKRRRLMVSSDSDFVSSEALLSDQGYSTSEEEREQVREANKFCGHLDVTLRKSSPKKKSEVEENLHQQRKHKARKGKEKVEDLKQVAAKQVCGICFSEEGKRTIRGTLDCCSHYFCFNCIMEWSKVESRCPLCKQRFAFLSKPARSDTMFDLRTTVIPIPERDQVYQPSEEELRSYLDPYENVICTECHHGGDDANMLLCDLCDSPAHTYCVGLSEVPEGNWYCEGCRPTALGPTNPQTPHSVRDWRSNTMSARSPPSESLREAIDLNRVYEPETPLAEGPGVSSSSRPVDGDIRASSWIPSPGVQTVRERRRRHQQMAQFAGRTDANIRLGTEVEWGRTRRLDSQNAIRPETSSFRNSFSQGMLHYNLTSPASNMRLFPASPSHPRAHRVWGQSLTGVNGPTDESVSLQPGPAGITGGDAWSFLGHSSMQ